MTAAPNSLTTLLQQHAQAALQLSQADQTAWNGKVVEAGEGILGLAHWDGTLHLDRECILDPLREMYDRSGEHQPEDALVRYREALVTLLHEQSHFLGPAGATQEAARSAFKLLGSRHLEEGVAEAWAHDSLDAYIRKLGIDDVAPGITEVRSQPSYAAFVPATRLLTADLDRLAQLPAGESLRMLNRETAEGQWGKVVDLIYRSSHLPEVVPPDREPAVRFHFERALRSSFRALETYEPFPRGFATSRSHAAGTRTLTLLHHELATAERHFQSARPCLPRPHQTLVITPDSAAPNSVRVPPDPVTAGPPVPPSTPSSPPPAVSGDISPSTPAAHQQPSTAFHRALSGLAAPGSPAPRLRQAEGHLLPGPASTQARRSTSSPGSAKAV